jgi:hypothetical protein
MDGDDGDSYYDDRNTEAGTNLARSDVMVSPIYYIGAVSNGDFSVIPSQPFVPLDIPVANGTKSVKIGDVRFAGSIDLDGDPRVFESCKALLLGSNLSTSIDCLVKTYETMGWALAKLSKDAVGAFIRHEHMDVPVVDDVHKYDDIAVDVYNSIVTGEKTVNSIAKEFSLSYQKVYGWLRAIKQKKELVPLYRNRIPAVRLPSYKDVKKLLDSAYLKKGCVSRSWREFCVLLKNAYPSVGGLSDKSIENRCRPLYRLRSMKPKTARQGRVALEQLALEITQGLLLCRVISKSENHVLFMDQSSFEYDGRRHVVIGGFDHRPHVTLQRPRSIHMYGACTMDGLFACRFSDSSSTAQMAADFVSVVCDEYCRVHNCPVVYVYIDNVRYQHTRVFKSALRSCGGFPFYGVRGSPFLNIIEDYFLYIKQVVKAGNPTNNNEYFRYMKDGVQTVSVRRSKLIHKRLFDNVIERVQRYRSLTGDVDIPAGVKMFKINSSVLRLNNSLGEGDKLN